MALLRAFRGIMVCLKLGQSNKSAWEEYSVWNIINLSDGTLLSSREKQHASVGKDCGSYNSRMEAYAYSFSFSIQLMGFSLNTPAKC
jgi:hypothetical protein